MGWEEAVFLFALACEQDMAAHYFQVSADWAWAASMPSVSIGLESVDYAVRDRSKRIVRSKSMPRMRAVRSAEKDVPHSASRRACRDEAEAPRDTRRYRHRHI